ncbi:putative permease [Ereboglobus sp. PH5-5]|uniref:AEC family transporter n=1 Tax=Ereboglobus sp. PH5-5 TaxID=2940529 RepID=UPI0024075728|nr:AEC family transporter [Ereboglobus sp. PH5-5]MDF9832919.1 putative permease [Ereboglobus sp. PH5-5]
MSFSYTAVLLSIVPVFGLVAIGVGLRAFKWVTPEADGSIMRMVVNCLYPCLIFENVLNNDALRNPANLAAAPVSGFILMGSSIVAALYLGRLLGLTQGHGLRTFAFASGINNYSYFALAVCGALFGLHSPVIGLTLVHAVGGEAAVWTVGIFVLAGLSLREGWKKLINGPLIALMLGLFFNLTGLREHIPGFLMETIHRCGLCGLTIGIILIGCTIHEYLAHPSALYHSRVTPIACILRLGVFPLVFLVVAKYLPFTDDMKCVLIVQAAMPAGMFPIAIAKHYNGQPLTAAQVVIGTTILGIITIPLWIKFGMAWVF